MARWGEWLEARTGWRSAARAIASEPMPGGASWGRSMGTVLLVLLGLEATTGFALAAFYSPSTTAAWASVYFIQEHVALGWLTRGLHRLCAEALVVVLVLHLLVTVWRASYRSPRELNWIAGLLMLNLVLALSHTGYLLPADQRAFFATQILLGITRSVPLIGEPAQKLIQGGEVYGELTLVRLYAAHAIVLPAALAALIAFHLRNLRRHGRAPDGTSAGEPYFPRQALRDLGVSSLIAGGLLVAALVRHGVALGAPADPSAPYPGRPEWYLTPIYQLRRWVEGELEWGVTVILPGMAMLFLVLLPFVHARLEQRGRTPTRPLALVVTAGLLAFIGLGVFSAMRDAADPSFQALVTTAQASAAEAHRLARGGVPVQGPLYLYRMDPLVFGKKVFVDKCVTCHQACNTVPFTGDPCLDGYASREWLTRFLAEPHAPLFFGNTKIDEMDPYRAEPAKLRAVVEFLYAQGDRPDVDDALAKRGETLFDGEGCGACHGVDGKGTGDAPDLKGYAGEEWVSSFIRNPASPRFYGTKNEMDPFDGTKLDAAELKAVVAFLRAQAPVKVPGTASSKP